MSYKTQLSYFISRHETKFPAHCAPNKAIGKNDTDREKNFQFVTIAVLPRVKWSAFEKKKEQTNECISFKQKELATVQGRKAGKEREKELSRLSVIF
ncbi:hypothetical protein CDAR_61071 [Caerostris darwini]|uniref:Uncharacterized protein n=1 Tax=Caerostris darwini TaxID=1538125 RepID=A0AAV4QAB4_9ARAC|nr:hypothetical protein CDAR_61071 [Caerostris darwini]